MGVFLFCCHAVALCTFEGGSAALVLLVVFGVVLQLIGIEGNTHVLPLAISVAFPIALISVSLQHTFRMATLGWLTVALSMFFYCSHFFLVDVNAFAAED